MKRVLTLALCALLAACGGSFEEDERATTEPVDCKAKPASCA
jgi:hypothetical protein